MKDLANYEKQESQRIAKQFETLKSEVVSLTKDKDKLERTLHNSKMKSSNSKNRLASISTSSNVFYETDKKFCIAQGPLTWFYPFQVDAAQGAEEMVEHLTEKTLRQEERLTQLEDEKADLVGINFWW